MSRVVKSLDYKLPPIQFSGTLSDNNVEKTYKNSKNWINETAFIAISERFHGL